MKQTLLILGLCLCLLPAAAVADPVDEARSEYLAGNYSQALEILVPAAEAGDANAQNILGAAYDEGNGVEIDYAAALDWWSKSAAQGFSKAQYNLGKMLAEGRPGVDPDPKRAEQLLRAAMAQKNADAFNEMGLLHALGRGRPVNLERAVEFYRQGAELGSRVAISNLGAAYAKGEGFEQDYSLAFQYISRAAAMGDRQALHNMGVLYENGFHVFRDLTAALFYYDAAFNAGYDKSAWHMATIIGVSGNYGSDQIEGLALCLWASEALPELKSEIDVDCAALSKDLKPDQIRAAQDRAKEL